MCRQRLVHAACVVSMRVAPAERRVRYERIARDACFMLLPWCAAARSMPSPQTLERLAASQRP
jgi:hypothetical protein